MQADEEETRHVKFSWDMKSIMSSKYNHAIKLNLVRACSYVWVYVCGVSGVGFTCTELLYYLPICINNFIFEAANDSIFQY